MIRFATVLLLGLVVVLVPGAGACAGIEAAMSAYQRGDYATAYGEFRTLAEQGHPLAQYQLGVMHHDGKGVARDYAEAAAWYSKAAMQGFAYAMSDLGLLYFNGHGVAKDYAEAVKWYRQAAEQGLPLAQHNLAAMLAGGVGAPWDFVEAYMWVELAAARGNAASARLRAAIAKRMTADQIAEAQQRARAWKPKSPASANP